MELTEKVLRETTRSAAEPEGSRTSYPPAAVLAATMASDTAPPRLTARADALESFAGSANDGRYESLEVIGSGGMGEVRLWRDRRVGRELAVKIAHASLGEDGRQRFAREALLQARLEHPAFVPVYDIARDTAGELYFTMRKVRGRTLRSILRTESDGRDRMPLHRHLAAFTQLCLALDYAHSRGVVHRDVKPDNVMLGDFGEVYLLDWGIAKILDEPEKNTDSLRGSEASDASTEKATAHGSILGTIGYMAPEQLRGENATLDHRADIYALGALLFEILTLEPMNTGATFGVLVLATLDGNGRSPALRAPSRDIAAELDAIVLRATQPDREQRYKNAREFAEDVERHLEGDRDVARRRTRAADLARIAADSLRDAGGDPEKRAHAGRVSARALAFDPAQSEARTVLLAVLGEAPAMPPKEAVVRVETARQRSEALGLRSFAITSLAVKALLIGLFVILGIHSTSAIFTITAGILGALITYREASRPTRSDAIVTLGFVFICLENAMFTQLSSPFVGIPIAVLASAIGVTVHAPKTRRFERTALAALVLVVPYVLEYLNVLPRTWIATSGTIRITPQMADVAPPAWFLVVHGVAILLGVAQALYPYFDDARKAELQVESSAWMLRRVLDPE